jgi:hypothetical protein
MHVFCAKMGPKEEKDAAKEATESIQSTHSAMDATYSEEHIQVSNW